MEESQTRSQIKLLTLILMICCLLAGCAQNSQKRESAGFPVRVGVQGEEPLPVTLEVQSDKPLPVTLIINKPLPVEIHLPSKLIIVAAVLISVTIIVCSVTIIVCIAVCCFCRRKQS